MILGRDVMPNERQRSDVEAPLVEQLEHHRVATTEARGDYAVISLVLTQPQYLLTVTEQRVARVQVQVPRFDLCQVRHDSRLGSRARDDQPLELRRQFTVR